VSNRGSGPAPSTSPVYPANKNDEAAEKRSNPVIRTAFRAATVLELPNRNEQLVREELSDEDAGAEAGIEADFRRKIAGLRHMPRHERSHALRAAKEARQLAFKALYDRRAAHRHAKHLLQRLRTPENG